jgi:hypothetical protein
VSSPVAALVFERTGGKRSKLAIEIQKLRDELAPARERLNKLEIATRQGKRSEAIRAERKWAAALEEVTTNFGPNPGLLDVRRLLSFGEGAGDIAADPTSLKAWLAALGGLQVEVLKRLLAQRPLIEIHRLRSELPGNEKLRASIGSLFGDVRSSSRSGAG